MNNFFSPGSNWYPFRWFIVIVASLTLGLSFVDYSGYRFLSFTGNQQRGYYGSPMYHK
jgi:hypothetical protein